MKKIRWFAVLSLVCLCSLPVYAETQETDEFAYLDDMTINQLKKLDAAIHERLGVNTFSDDHMENQDAEVKGTTEDSQDHMEESKDLEIVLDPPYIVTDNECVKLYFTSIAREEFSGNYRYVIHYTVENKDSECSVRVHAPLGSLYIGSKQVNFAVSGDETQPLKTSDNGEIVALVYLQNGSSTKGSENIRSLEDLFDLNGKLDISVYNRDANTRHSDAAYGLSLEGYRFEADGKGYSFEDSLQGEWKTDYNSVVTTFAFDHGIFNGGNSNGDSVSGTYQIDYGTKTVAVDYDQNDTSYTMTIPFLVNEDGIALYGSKSNQFFEKTASY